MAFGKKNIRKAPSIDDVIAEAAAFRAESELLRKELTALRGEITNTMGNLDQFSQTMKAGTS